MDVNLLLNRLRKVKATGRDKWLACCPAHDDKNPSLSVRVAENGTILIRCWGGCGAADVIGAVGLSFSDLFPQALPPQQHSRPRIRQPFTADDALRCLASEAGVIAIAAADIVEGRKLSTVDSERIDLAMGRITDAVGYVYG